MYLSVYGFMTAYESLKDVEDPSNQAEVMRHSKEHIEAHYEANVLKTTTHEGLTDIEGNNHVLNMFLYANTMMYGSKVFVCWYVSFL